MGWGSSGTPPWIDAKKMDEEKKRKKLADALAENEALKQENEKLKKRIKQLEDEIGKLK
jgi:cell division protein FtsB